MNFSNNPIPIEFKLLVYLVSYLVRNSFFFILLLIILFISVLCSEGRLKVVQNQPYGEINIFINNTYDPLKQILPDIQTKSSFESDDSHF
jgi:hypothetical protein